MSRPSSIVSRKTTTISQSTYVTAEHLFQKARRRAMRKQLWAWLRDEDRTLHMLDELDATAFQIKREQTHAVVPLKRINGSLARADEFDIDFLPLTDTYRNRWISVCAGILTDPLSLPRVTLIKADGNYYVEDGHHRISVASILDKLAVDAVVTIWERHD